MSDSSPQLALPPRRGRYGLATGIGLVVANMVGSGVLTTAGFMADTLGPLWILVAWVVGGLIALAGARVYAALADELPGSGGEYRYLSKLVHPFAGYLAGWTSLLVGFSAPVAMAGLAAGAYLGVLLGVDPRTAAVVAVVAVTAVHAFHIRASALVQDTLVSVKAVLLAAFLLTGLALGSKALPAWQPTSAADAVHPLAAFFNSLVFIGFCYSGWNAVVYVADEFAHPKRDVPRAMMIGTLLVTLLYLGVNWVFVANLTPADLAVVKTEDEKLTLGHVVLSHLLGPSGAIAMSSVVLIALISSLSAMTLVGPRVYAAMAEDRFLPGFFRQRADSPPLASVLLQSAVAIVLILTQQFAVLLNNAGSILTLTSMLAVAALAWRKGRSLATSVKWAAALYCLASAWALIFSIKSTPSSLVWMSAITVAAALGYRMTRHVRARQKSLGTPLPAVAPAPANEPLLPSDAERKIA